MDRNEAEESDNSNATDFFDRPDDLDLHADNDPITEEESEYRMCPGYNNIVIYVGLPALATGLRVRFQDHVDRLDNPAASNAQQHGAATSGNASAHAIPIRM